MTITSRRPRTPTPVVSGCEPQVTSPLLLDDLNSSTLRLSTMNHTDGHSAISHRPPPTRDHPIGVGFCGLAREKSKKYKLFPPCIANPPSHYFPSRRPCGNTWQPPVQSRTGGRDPRSATIPRYKHQLKSQREFKRSGRFYI